MVRLVRSKGVGVYFVTQNPMDVPGEVLSQLGNRVQHALRAYTPAEQKKVKTAADTFRPNPNFKTADAIMELATGEALVSFLQDDGSPAPVERVFILPPQSRMGGVEEEERRRAMENDGVGSRYDEPVDRESAYEMLTQRAQELEEEEEAAEEAAAEEKAAAAEKKAEAKEAAAKKKVSDQKKAKAAKKAESLVNNAAKSATRSVISSTLRRSVTKDQSIAERALNSAYNSAINGIGREITSSVVRGIFGTLMKKK